MNATLCKYLRKTARLIGTQAKYPEKELLAHQHHNGALSAYNSPQSIRGIYRHLKKQARKHFRGTDTRRTQATPSG